jgi:hypothetical protein
MTWQELCALGMNLPEVTEDTWYGTPALKVRGKGFVRLKEDGANVVFMLESVDEQEALIRLKPKIYFITDHYRGYATVLARLAALPTKEAKQRLEDAWRVKATKALVKKFDESP